MDTAIEWNEGFQVGIDTVDEQHRQLFALVNRLGRLAKETGRRGVTKAIIETLDELGAAASEHFAHEESLMQAVHFAGLTEHAREHRMLLGELRAIAHAIKSGRDRFDQKVFAALRQWLVVHNRYNERAFAEACRKALRANPGAVPQSPG